MYIFIYGHMLIRLAPWAQHRQIARGVMPALYGQYRKCSAGVPCVFKRVLKCSSLNVINILKCPSMPLNVLF